MTAQLGSPVFHAGDYPCDCVCDWGDGGGGGGAEAGAAQVSTPPPKVKKLNTLFQSYALS